MEQHIPIEYLGGKAVKETQVRFERIRVAQPEIPRFDNETCDREWKAEVDSQDRIARSFEYDTEPGVDLRRIGRERARVVSGGVWVGPAERPDSGKLKIRAPMSLTPIMLLSTSVQG